jgi:trans-2,3-dihydro-3-hydroxyanthranilate isomerase
MPESRESDRINSLGLFSVAMRIKQVDSFTSEPFSGNPAGVVVDADDLSDEQMQIIAREMNLSETCFISSSSKEEIDFRFRWFTPTIEVDACGHATLAGLHILAEESHIPLSEEPTHLSIDTKSGVWNARVWLEENRPMVMFSMLHGQLSLEACPIPLDELARILRVDINDIGIGGYEPEILQANFRQLVVPIGSMDSLKKMRPDFSSLSEILEELGTSMHLFTQETVIESSDVHSRHFAPNYGIDEDPVTGAGNAALFAYLLARGLVDVNKPVTHLVGEQGHIVGRPGYVKGEVHIKEGEIEQVAIGGNAVTVMDAEMDLSV